MLLDKEKTPLKAQPNVLICFGQRSPQRIIAKQGLSNTMINKKLQFWIVKKKSPLIRLWSLTELLKQRAIIILMYFSIPLTGKQDLGINLPHCQEFFLGLRELLLINRPLRSERNPGTDEEHTGILHRTVGFFMWCGYDAFSFTFPTHFFTLCSLQSVAGLTISGTAP